MVSDFHSCKEMQLFGFYMVILMLDWREEAKNKLIKERLLDGEIHEGKI
jgi:hypothetical protein